MPYKSQFRSLHVNSQPKSQPKPATAGKAANNGVVARGRGRGGRRGRNAGRGKPKTADELDAEMVDYFDAPGGTGGNTDGATTNGAATAVANGEDLGMDEISVSALSFDSPRDIYHLLSVIVNRSQTSR